MDKSLCEKAAEYFDKYPEKVVEAEQWYKANNLADLDEALKLASDSGYWVGCLYVAYNYYLIDGCIALAESIKAGTFPPNRNPDEQIVENALREAKKTALKPEDKNHRPPLGKTAQKIYDILKALPETQGLTSEQIADLLSKLPGNKSEVHDASNLRKNHLPQLEPYGLLKTEHGYCIR